MSDRESDIRILTELCGWKWFMHLRNTVCRWIARPSNPRTMSWQPCEDEDMALPIAGDISDFLVPLSESLDECMKHIVPAMKARGYWLVLRTPISNEQFEADFTTGRIICEGHAESPAQAVVKATLAYLDAQGETE